MTIFLTNATGFVGAHLANRFVKEKTDLAILIRSKNVSEAMQRLERAFYLMSQDLDSENDKISICKGDITFPSLGLSEVELRKLKSTGIDELWHSAGSVAFAKNKRDETMAINYGGMRNVLEFASWVGVKDFHYISTAYSQGNAPVILKERQKLPDFNNAYEESKYLSEELLFEWARENPNVKVFVYRPSIIVGDSLNGRAFNFSGYYRYMQVFHFIKQMFESGRRKIDGVGFDSEGVLHLPISVPGAYDAEVNLITIDYAIERMMSLRKYGEPGVYSIVNDNPPIYGELLKNGLRFLRIEGVKILVPGQERKKPKELERIESMIGRGMADYLPYISQTFRWEEKSGTSHPGRIDYAFVSKILAYAVLHDFDVRV